MKVIFAESMGYCMGVKKAMQMTYNVIEEEKGKKISTFGPLIHNRLVLEDLASKGVNIIDDPEKGEGVVIIRAHGVSPEIKKRLEEKAEIVIDATCPRVLNSQKKVKEASVKGAHIVIAGDRNHGEVQGLAGFAESYDIVENALQADKIVFKMPALVISQTTFSENEYNLICSALKRKYPDIEVAGSICPATEKRQKALAVMAEVVDAVIVVGGKTSANTKRLYQSALKLGKKAWHIENSDEIPEEIRNFDKVGITAGASTPDWIIKKVADKLKLY
ncbi:MAG: 4-hydroxy-3-methylbut-2-enyl diphosphate reductase [Spirochaetia bacterium]|nr:4-hydroxy-3-methylbut-2-enyl diphosphate reductase [Spirochaetia bacterium]